MQKSLVGVTKEFASYVEELQSEIYEAYRVFKNSLLLTKELVAN